MIDERTQAWAARLVGLAVVVLFGWLAFEQIERMPRPEPTAAPADAGVAETATEATVDAGVALAVEPVETSDAGSALELLTLRAGAPRTVKLGVILVTYQGAEGAATSTRTRAQAKALAESLAETAKADFRRAAVQGDPGSSEDIGRIPRGVLDPSTEIAVFNLRAGETSSVLETPRGYWIVKRHD